MSTRLQVILLIVLILAIGFIVSEISKKKIDFKFGIVWIVISLVLILFTIWNGLLIWLTHLVGIATPINFLYLLAILLLVWIVYSMSKTIALLQEKIKRLSQELAILRKDSARGKKADPLGERRKDAGQSKEDE